MAEPQKTQEPYIIFELAGTSYGLPSRQVQQMEMVEDFTPVPNAPNYVEGLVFLRGQVIPAINLRVRFGFEKTSYDLRTRLVVVQVGGRSVGLIVDSAREFVLVPSRTIQPPPEAVSGLSGRYLEGVATLGERMVLILNVEEVLNWAEGVIVTQAQGEEIN
jgi:purine-binding chemotaxis protein CheW